MILRQFNCFFALLAVFLVLFFAPVAADEKLEAVRSKNDDRPRSNCTLSQCFEINWKKPDFKMVTALPAGITDNLGSTPLHYAARNCVNSSYVYHSLVEQGHDVNAIDPSTGYTPAQAALTVCRGDVLGHLLNLGANPNVPHPKYGGNMLHMVLRLKKPISIFKRLLQTEVNPDLADNNGITPLIILLSRNNAQLAEHMIEEGADPNVKDSNGITIAHYAALNGNDVFLHKLLILGADLEARSNRGQTPLHLATMSGINPKLASIFVLAEVDVNIPDNEGRSPLHYVSGKGSAREVATLLVLGADPNQLDNNGENSLHYALKHNRDSKVVTALLRLGVDPNQLDSEGKKTISLARFNPRAGDVIRELIDYGVDINAIYESNRTELHNAIINKNPELVAILLEYGADPNVPDENGDTAIDLFVRYGAAEPAAGLLNKLKLENDELIEKTRQRVEELSNEREYRRKQLQEERLILEEQRAAKKQAASDDNEDGLDDAAIDEQRLDQIQNIRKAVGNVVENIGQTELSESKNLEESVISIQKQLAQILEESVQRREFNSSDQ